VKNLAVQAAKATDQINGEIDGIQVTSASVAAAVVAINDSMSTGRGAVQATASAVGRQTGVSRAMSEGIRGAAEDVAAMTASIGESEAAMTRLAEGVTRTRQAAEVLAR
jgi:methyl-accepting chemotaxis protein